MREERRTTYRIKVIGQQNRWRCHYCGCPGDEMDHIPPTSRYHDAMASDDWFEPILVPACRECNGLAGNELHTSFLERAEFVKAKLAKKYRHQLRVVAWTEDELEDMGYSLRVSIEQNMAAKAFVRGRLDFFPVGDVELEDY